MMTCMPKIKIPFQIAAAVLQRGKGFWAVRQSKGLKHACIYTAFSSLCFSNKNCGRLSPFIASTFLLRVLFLQRNIAEHLFKMLEDLKTWIAMNPFIYKHSVRLTSAIKSSILTSKRKNSEVRFLSLSYRNGHIARVKIASSKQDKANFSPHSFLT